VTKIRLWVSVGLAVFVLTGAAAPAFAQDGSGDNPPPLGKRIVRNNDNSSGSGVLGERSATSPESVLPFTGSDLLLTLMVGAALIGAGTLVVRQYRLRRSPA
jgi:hypothetical protein